MHLSSHNTGYLRYIGRVQPLGLENEAPPAKSNDSNIVRAGCAEYANHGPSPFRAIIHEPRATPKA